MAFMTVNGSTLPTYLGNLVCPSVYYADNANSSICENQELLCLFFHVLMLDTGRTEISWIYVMCVACSVDYHEH